MQPPARRDLWMKVERDGPKRRDTTQDTGNPDLEFLLMHIPTEYRRSFFLWTNCRLQQRHSHFLLSFFHLEYEWISAAYSMIHTIHSLHLINIYRNCILSWLSGWVYGRDEFCVTTATTRLRTPPCSTTQTSPGIVQRKGKWRRRRDATHNPPFWCFYGLAETTWEGPVASFFFSLWYAEEHTPWQPKGKQKYPPVIWEQQHLSFCVCIQFAKMYTALYKFILHIIKLLKFFFSFNWTALWMSLFLILYEYKLQLKTTYSIGNKIIQDLLFFFYSVTQQRVCLTG